MTLNQIRQSVLVNGEGLDKKWRARLVTGLAILADHLWRVGIEEIYINGSFVTNKPRPGDIDGYYVCDAHSIADGSIFRALNEVAGDDIWDITKRVSYHGGPPKPLMWHKYRIELYPHCEEIHLNFPHPPFPQFFRQTRAGTGKGIVKLIKG